jgi:hypothetical protein
MDIQTIEMIKTRNMTVAMEWMTIAMDIQTIKLTWTINHMKAIVMSHHIPKYDKHKM